MRMSAVVEVKVDKPIRIQRLVREYGDANKEEFLQAMQNVTKKLGGQHFNTAKEKLMENDMHSTIDILLTYYDKAYLRGLEKKKHRIKFESSWNGIFASAQTLRLPSNTSFAISGAILLIGQPKIAMAINGSPPMA